MKANFYLKSGQQTKITKQIRQVAADFKLKGIDLIFEILTWLHQNIKLKSELGYKNKVFRRRTASQIITSGYACGCTDYALVFISLIRAKSIPAKYIEAINTDWFQKHDLNHLEGHVFSEVYLNNRWYIIDPQAAVIRVWYGKRYQKVADGLDSWHIGIKNLSDLRKIFTEVNGDRE